MDAQEVSEGPSMHAVTPPPSKSYPTHASGWQEDGCEQFRCLCSRSSATSGVGCNILTSPSLLESRGCIAKGACPERAKPLVARPEWRACPTHPYVWTAEGWLYLAVVLDLYSSRVIAWGMGRRLTQELATAALTTAMEHRRPTPGVVHTDRGAQYVAPCIP
jgi:transposase InsO family protein